jgi:hypothetical protein
MRVLISTSSSFWLSREAVLRAREFDASWAFPDSIAIKGEPKCWMDDKDRDEMYSIPSGVPRHDPVLLQVFDELGGEKMAGKGYGEIICIEVPDDLTYYIGSYTGEWVAEQHREWFPHSEPGGELAGGIYAFTKDSKFSPGSY